MLILLFAAAITSELISSIPPGDIHSEFKKSTLAEAENENQKQYLWNEWGNSNGFFQLMFPRFYPPEIKQGTETHVVHPVNHDDLPDIELHFGQNVFDRLLPMNLLQRVVNSMNGRQLIYDTLPDTSTPKYYGQQFKVGFKNLRIQKLMINGLNNGKVNYNVFDHGKEWKVEYNKAFQNSFDGSSMEDLNRYLKINGDKIQLALRGLNFVLTGTCSIRGEEGLMHRVGYGETVDFYLRVKDAVVILPLKLVADPDNKATALNLYRNATIEIGNPEVAIQIVDSRKKRCQESPGKERCEQFLKKVVNYFVNSFKTAVGANFGEILKSELPVVSMFGAISIQKTVSKILTGFLRTTSGLTPKFSKYNDPEKTDITKPEHEYYCSYDEDYKNVKKFGLSDFVIHDIKWKSEDDHVKYSIRVNSISEQVSSELEAIFNQKYKEKWCDALKGVREATEEGQNQKYFNDLRTISKGVYNAAN